MNPYGHPGYYRWPTAPPPPGVPVYPRFPQQRWIPAQAPVFPHGVMSPPPPPPAPLAPPAAASKSQSSSSDDGSKPKFIPLKRSLQDRFYGPLALLVALQPDDKRLADHAPGFVQVFHASVLRNFLDAICYICDRDKGDANTTTAAALEQRDGKVIVRLAASGGIKEITCDLLTRILDLCLSQIKAGEPAVSKKLLAMAIVHSMPRLKKYEKLAEAELRACSKEIYKSDAMRKDKRYMEVIRWFHSFLEQSALKERGLDKMLHLIPFCHQARYSDGVIREFLEDQIHDGQADCFSRLWHYVGRLAEHIQALKAIHQCLVEYPRIGASINVKSVPEPPSDIFPLLPPETFPRDLLAAMFPDGESDERLMCKEYLERMARMLGRKGRDNLKRRLKTKCEKTRVHAELLVLDWFRHNNLSFFEDAYIACSKPVCYLCYRYFQAVEANGYGTVMPKTSNKLRADWRCPDVPADRGDVGYRIRKRDMKKMVKFIGQDLMDALHCLGIKPWYPDPSVGLDSLPKWRIQAKSASDAGGPTERLEDHAAELVDREAEEERAATREAAAGQLGILEQIIVEEELVDAEDTAEGALGEEEVIDDPSAAGVTGEAQATAEVVTHGLTVQEGKEIVDSESEDDGTSEEGSEEEGSFDEDDGEVGGGDGVDVGEEAVTGEEEAVVGEDAEDELYAGIVDDDIAVVIVEPAPEEVPPAAPVEI